MRAELYTRASTDKQTEKYGIPSQLEALRERSLERKWAPVIDGDKDAFVDDGYSEADNGQNIEILAIIPLGEQLHPVHREGLGG